MDAWHGHRRLIERVSRARSTGAPTIHVATVHWNRKRWIDIQRRYLARNLRRSHRVYASLTGVPPGFGDTFFYTSREPIKDHATKLNLLCDVICSSADDPADVLMVIDGDAFPVAPARAAPR